MTATISYDQLESLEQRFGDSFFLYDLDVFASNYREFLEALRAKYPHSEMAYSYKTNYTPRLCALVQQWGGYAEVVSSLEYDLALGIGVPPDRVIFNGPYKTIVDIERTLSAGAIVNIDWPYQIELVRQFAERRVNGSVRVGIRTTFRLDNTPPSRFGFDADSDELVEVIQQLRAIRNVGIVALHCHFLTKQRSLGDFRTIARRMTGLTKTHFPDDSLKIVDVGGGFFSRMKPELQAQFGISTPSLTEYGHAIGEIFAQAFPNQSSPELVVEPGISITADIARFVVKVIDTRELQGRKLALVPGSFYDIKPTGTKRNLPMSVIARPRSRHARAVRGLIDVVGFTCMEHDVLYSAFEGEIHVGDYLVFENVGAYTSVLRPPFIRAASAIVGISESEPEPVLLKRAEDSGDVFASYAFSRDGKSTHRARAPIPLHNKNEKPL